MKTIFTTLDPVFFVVMDPALQGTDLKQNPILAGTNALKQQWILHYKNHFYNTGSSIKCSDGSSITGN
jgi:hypothetical protein